MSLLTPSAPESPEAMLSEITEAAVKHTKSEAASFHRGSAAQTVSGSSFPISPPRSASTTRSAADFCTIRLGMLRLAKAVLPLYPTLNEDLLISGVIIYTTCVKSKNWTAINSAW